VPLLDRVEAVHDMEGWVMASEQTTSSPAMNHMARCHVQHIPMQVSCSNLLSTLVYKLLRGNGYWKLGRSLGHGLAGYVIMSILPQVRYPVETIGDLWNFFMRVCLCVCGGGGWCWILIVLCGPTPKSLLHTPHPRTELSKTQKIYCTTMQRREVAATV
jgi:hypothetical protein